MLVPEMRREVFPGDVAGPAVDDEAGVDGGPLGRSGEGHVCGRNGKVREVILYLLGIKCPDQCGGATNVS